MKFPLISTLVLGLLSSCTIVCATQSKNSTSTSRLVLPKNFTPPQTFKNVNLVRTTSLEKAYVRETVNVVVENTGKQPQSDYYIPYPSSIADKLGGLEVRDKRAPAKPRFEAQVMRSSTPSDSEYIKIHFPEPLKPSSQITLSITYYILSALRPLPATINQDDKQYLTYTFNAYAQSAYPTDNQKTKVKFIHTNIPNYTKTSGLKSGEDPENQGTALIYGSYTNVAPTAAYPITVRYEATRPVTVSSRLERDLEVSHWGGNLATEERYWLRNDGAQLTTNFDRVLWQMRTYVETPTSALREIRYPLRGGSVDPYFIDDIGNVSTSRYRSGTKNREASLELIPRYPVFGGWNYSFRVGWNNDLSTFLRKTQAGSDSYVLKVPFVEGPNNLEGIQYDEVVVRVILPEGAINLQYEIIDTARNGLPHPSQIHSDTSKLITYMDTIGRTVLTLKVDNLSDEARGSELVISYDYPFAAGFRKPLTICGGLLAIFATAWFIGTLDVRIKAR